ncbi:hypothetical protein N0V90_004356 [Kalmusia sp. IMI 367209]|nr:hypothetical protein N0V90_004356 [Kalmusia sp. IMI 367209]
MTVGSNNQNISFFASGDYNETYIYGTDGFCTDVYSSEACVTLRGSAYDTSQSSTDKSIGNRKDSDGFEADWTEDTLSFGSNTSLFSFGFGVPQQDLNQAFTSQSQLGLGMNSSFLRALVSAGDIGTKAYSMFWGLVGGPVEKQTRGSLVLGGLDKSLIADQNDNFTASLFRSSSYYGGLTIELQNSISVKIPNTELVVPDTYIASDGVVQANTSVRNLVINSLQSDNDNDLPILGRLFMSSAYIMVNQEAGRFSVWQVNIGSKTSDIVAVDKQNNMVSEFCANSTDGSSSATPSLTSSVIPPPQNEGSKLSGSAIGGIVVGAVGAIAILGAIGFYLYRRRGLGGATGVAQEPELQTADVKPPTYGMVPAGPQELPVDQYNVTELDSRTVDSRRH